MHDDTAFVAPADLIVEAFQTADGNPAVLLRLPGAAELRMIPAAAILLSTQLFCAAFEAQAGGERRMVATNDDVEEFVRQMSAAIITGKPAPPPTGPDPGARTG